MKKLKKFLKKIELEERLSLAEILEAESAKPKHITQKMQSLYLSVFGQLFELDPSYREILEKVADKLKIEIKENEFYDELSVKELEVKITQHVFQAGLEQMTDEQRDEFEKELTRVCGEFGKSGEVASSAGVLAALGAAQLSGFGVYLLATSTLGALTGAVGLTLPFAAYTAMSSTIAVVIGPVGWISAGLFAVWKLTGTNYKKLVPAIVFITAARAKFDGGFE